MYTQCWHVMANIHLFGTFGIVEVSPSPRFCWHIYYYKTNTYWVLWIRENFTYGQVFHIIQIIGWFYCIVLVSMAYSPKLSPPVFITKILYVFHFSPIHAQHTYHSPWFGNLNNIWWRVQTSILYISHQYPAIISLKSTHFRSMLSCNTLSLHGLPLY